jgi:uncharacterized membrane protein YdbT with pleckstrin-like domain
MISTILIGIIVAAGLWWFLDSREKRRVNSGLPRHSALRLVVAVVFALVAIFSGGCSLAFLYSLSSGPQQYISVPAVLVIGGVPFVISAFIWWLCMRRNSG